MPYTSRLPEEQGGDTVATYSYAAADTAAEESGSDLGAQVLQIFSCQKKLVELSWGDPESHPDVEEGSEQC